VFEANWLRVPRPAVARGTRIEATCRRRQRQVHSRLQCDPEHLKALAELVAGMVRGGSQCYVYEAPGLGRVRERDVGSGRGGVKGIRMER
jgi:alpha-beta hydrolase superfamily lysophospholipase